MARVAARAEVREARGRFGEFVRMSVNPGARERDRSCTALSRRVFREAAEVGLMGFSLPAGVGGAERDKFDWGGRRRADRVPLARRVSGDDLEAAAKRFQNVLWGGDPLSPGDVEQLLVEVQFGPVEVLPEVSGVAMRLVAGRRPAGA